MHFKFIVREYHRFLRETLVKLKFQGHIPSLKEIHIEIIKNSLIGRAANSRLLNYVKLNNYFFSGVIAATCLTPLIFREGAGFESLEDLNSRTETGDRFRRENVENPKYRAFLQRTVKEFELSGFLDT